MKYLTNIDLNKNQLINAVIQPLATAPSSPAMGQIYYNTTDKVMYQYSGTAWVAVGEAITYGLDLGLVTNNTIPINLVGSDGTTDTVYIKGAGDTQISKDGENIVITTAGSQTVTYTFTGAMSANNYVITITPSVGVPQTVTVPLSNYVLNTITINGKPLSANVTLTTADIEDGGGNTINDLLDEKVNTTTTINGKSLSDDVTLTTDDIESTSGKTVEELLEDKVDTSLKINGKALSSDIELKATDIKTTGGDTIEEALADKVDVVAGKGLSTNDYDNTEKALVAGALQTSNLASATGISTTTTMTQKAITDALNLKVDAEAGKGLSENDFTDEYVDLVDGAVQKDGSVPMEADLSLGTHKITNLGNAINDADAVNFKQLKDKIAALGTVFNLKGAKATIADLPSTGNTVGDVWYVKSESAGFIWINKSVTATPEYGWEEFGPAIDLSGYLEIADLATATGASTTTAMTQKAVTDALALKADKADTPVMAFTDVTMATTATTASISVDGDIMAITVKDSVTGEVVIADIDHTGDGTATVTVATNPTNALSIRVLYMEEE